MVKLKSSPMRPISTIETFPPEHFYKQCFLFPSQMSIPAIESSFTLWTILILTSGAFLCNVFTFSTLSGADDNIM